MFSKELDGLSPALGGLALVTSDLYEYALPLFAVIVDHLSKEYRIGSPVQRVLNLISSRIPHAALLRL